ncbi:MAG TPA: metallophosphoesterase [Polyangia bacterium]|nr:metallophosphoesterase [Polyangia bacterium]
MARPRRNLTRFRAMVLSVVGGVQIPGVAAVAHFIRSWPLAAAGATLITLPYLMGLRSPFEDRPKGRLYLYGGLWPFFAWWTACLAFAVLAPIALGVAWVARAPIDPPLAIAFAVAILAGISATAPRPRIVRREIAIAGLPRALDGYRIAQISDVHCGSYTPAERVAEWADRLSALEPDLVAITGDLITSGSAHVDGVAAALGRLRGRDGVFACMGNHDYFTDAERLVRALESHGITVLRNRGVTLERGGAALHVAGVDDTWTGRADVARSLSERPAGVPVLLLAHDPNLFPDAAARGVELTLSGHTHGGQLAVPGLSRKLNLARLITPFAAGIYRLGAATLYVSRGAGTTGPPVRLGARAELTLLTLRALDK